MSLEIIRTPDMIELNDCMVRKIVQEYVERTLGRKVLAIRYYHSSSATRGEQMYLKVDLAFQG